MKLAEGAYFGETCAVRRHEHEAKIQQNFMLCSPKCAPRKSFVIDSYINGTKTKPGYSFSSNLFSPNLISLKRDPPFG
uniref:Uncharacterized protein n=1 Tax=Candidatus Giovannonibacteria bacterium GW2011_GWF2_42_19 TaxID=1618659 RepID=A0A0G0ZC30_9BACT|nr:MAG: hypothetical protein UV11_C0031G0017 [Candidatus Giovannonibacteria bacterium GW2011_GWF2_42_19]